MIIAYKLTNMPKNRSMAKHYTNRTDGSLAWRAIAYPEERT